MRRPVAFRPVEVDVGKERTEKRRFATWCTMWMDRLTPARHGVELPNLLLSLRSELVCCEGVAL